jgi:hypothetical protein
LNPIIAPNQNAQNQLHHYMCTEDDGL